MTQATPAAPQRGPCPVLNALANDGVLPTTGMVTKDDIVRALEDRLNVPRSISRVAAQRAVEKLAKPRPPRPPLLSLAALALHGFIEHDASLTRRDARFGDQRELVRPLLDQLLAMSEDGLRLTLDDLAVAHQLRVAQSAGRGNPIGLLAAVLGTAEVALLHRIFAKDGGIPLADVEELFQKERIPENVAPQRTTLAGIMLSAAYVAIAGNVPLFSAARRARKAALRIPDPEAEQFVG